MQALLLCGKRLSKSGRKEKVEEVSGLGSTYTSEGKEPAVAHRTPIPHAIAAQRRLRMAG